MVLVRSQHKHDQQISFHKKKSHTYKVAKSKRVTSGLFARMGGASVKEGLQCIYHMAADAILAKTTGFKVQ